METKNRITTREMARIRKILEKSADPERANEILNLALRKAPEDYGRGRIYGDYVLEVYWCWDHSHYEFATICVENFSDELFEDLLNPLTPEEVKNRLLADLDYVFRPLVAMMGKAERIRLYRVIRTDYFGYSPGTSGHYTPPGRKVRGCFEREVVEIHFTLKPLFDFDENGQPVPCFLLPEPK